MARILVADDEPGIREFLAEVLEADAHLVARARDGSEAARLLDRQAFDLLITDLRMPGRDGMELVRQVRAERPDTQVVVLTAHGSVASAVEAMKLGAFEYLEKPMDSPEAVSRLVTRALDRRRLTGPRAGAGRRAEGDPQLGYGDPAMAPVVRDIERVARSAATVLLLGESGTGKGLAARTIHRLSDRRNAPFLAVNCAALAETLLESELFGHEKGAFTGASEQRRGRIELAEGGTLLLDEVAELRPPLQAKLLRVIEERRFERVGGSSTLRADVRWIAATNRDPREALEAGTFRADLYHRLAVFPIRLPALRERPADVLPLAEALLARVAADLGRGPLSLSPAAKDRLLSWHYPGNVRELANTIERAAILAEGPVIEAEHVRTAHAGTSDPALKALAELERDAIERALRSVGGNRRRAAEILGIGERTLYEKIKRYRIRG